MKNYIWLISAAGVLVGLFVYAIWCDIFECEGPRPEPYAIWCQIVGCPPPPTPPPTQGPVITIDFFSSNTKENWIGAIVELFNEAQHTIASGERIVVKVTHVTSGGSKEDILKDKIKPIQKFL